MRTAATRSRTACGSVRRWVIEGGLALAQPPVVDGFADDVDGLGPVVGGQDDGDVLVQHALREGEAASVPEGAAEDLVAGDPVGDEARVVGDVHPAAEVTGQHPEERHLPGLLPAQMMHVPGGEVRARLVQAPDHRPVRVGRYDVVAVDEGDVLARRGDIRETGVTGRPQPRVLLAHQPEPPVARRVLGGDGGRAVR